MKDPRAGLRQLMNFGEEMKVWNGISALLEWDQETQMPAKGLEMRSKQCSALSTHIHAQVTAKKVGNVLDSLGADDDHLSGSDELCAGMNNIERAFIRQMYRTYSRATKLPSKLVRKLAETTSTAQAIWAEARQNNDFAVFQPWLEKVVDLKLQVAEAYGYADHPYDALLDVYEPGMKTADIDRIFTACKAELIPLVKKIAEAKQINNSFLTKTYPTKIQEEFCKKVLKSFKYPMDRSRLDISTHPFAIELGDDDVRITTRYLENFFNSAFFSVIHEAGHAMYELGMGEEVRNNMLAGGTSLGIHESQSRTWENIIGRSHEFWQYFFPVLKQMFPDPLNLVDIDSFWRGINKVEPSFIRVEADEVTYNLHVMLRFELEKSIIDQKLAVRDLPEVWNEGMWETLGIRPGTDSEGVLQDVHWSVGHLGYFSTYALGNFYGAQFWNAMLKDLPETNANIATGNFSPIQEWLQQHIYKYGSSKTAAELTLDISGEPLNEAYFMNYLKNKYYNIYSLV